MKSNQSVNNYGSGSIHGFTQNGNIIYNQNFREVDFVEIPFKELESQFKDSPEITADLIGKLEQERLLVLGGNLGTDKNELALQLAFLIAKKNSNSNDPNISIKQWRASSNQKLVDIALELKNTEHPSIFVLTDVELKDIGHNGLENSSQTAKRLNKHWIIVTSHKGFAKWHLPEKTRRFFVESRFDDEENKQERDEAFIKELYHEKCQPHERLLALGLSFFKGCLEDQLFAGLEKVFLEAWREREPSLRFLDYEDLDKLESEYFELSRDIDLYETTSSKFRVVENKTYKIDIRSIKILSENRDILFREAWNNQRRLIISALNVLADIVKESVKVDSSEQDYFELYGTAIKRQNIRQAISQTITDIGLISNSASKAVQPALRKLAEHNNPEVRSVAVSAISRWYEEVENEQKQKVFRILEYFYDLTLKEEKFQEQELEKRKNDEYLKALEQRNKRNRIPVIVVDFFKTILSRFKQHKQEKQEKQDDYLFTLGIGDREFIGISITEIIGKVIYNYYGTEELSDEFYNWLKELAESRFRTVHLSFAYYTLFWIVPLHLKEERIFNLLKELTQRNKYIFEPEQFSPSGYSFYQAIALSLAHAYKYPDNRERVLEILDGWYQECFNKKESEEIDALLKTVVLAYGFIEYKEQYDEQEDEQNSLIEEVFNRLAKTLEHKPSVRKATIFAICSLTGKYFEEVEIQLQDVLSEFKRQEQEQLVEKLTEIYLEQRFRIRGTEADIEKTIEVKGRKYQLWKQPEKRPLTPIEKTLNRWVKLENKAPAQQTALKALVSFANALGKEAQYQ